MAGITYAELLKSDRNWVNDFKDENGNYINTCSLCKESFLGHKYRRVCHLCYKPPYFGEIVDIERFNARKELLLADLAERERGITITTAHPKPFIMDSLPLLNKSPDIYWRKGKLRTKKKKK